MCGTAFLHDTKRDSSIIARVSPKFNTIIIVIIVVQIVVFGLLVQALLEKLEPK